MKKRSIWKVFVLYVITLSFYRLVWLAKTRKELIKKTKISIPSVWWLVLPYILVAASLVLFVVFAFKDEVDFERVNCDGLSARACNDIAAVEGTTSTAGTIALVMFYVSFVVIVPLMSWWYWKYSKAVEAVTKEKTNFAVAMLVILAVPDGFDMCILQDSFNKIAPKKS